jgi:phenylalanyl-tRNA synthetase beta chain
MNSSNS